jgi:hypothetical protein
MIDLIPPGVYEAVITRMDESVENPELVAVNHPPDEMLSSLYSVFFPGGTDGAKETIRFYFE